MLKEHGLVLGLAATPNSAWSWHVRRLLALNTDLLVGGGESATVPLRLLEIFTCVRTAAVTVGEERAAILVASVLGHLIPRGYLAKTRAVLEARTPPLLVASPRPPAPMAGSILELLARPLQLVHVIAPADFRFAFYNYY